jgi:hypothetical protein
MCDFLISFCKGHQGRGLLSAAKVPYGTAAPEGRSFDFTWGSMAVLEEPLADGKNVIEKGRWTVAWVGDLVTEMTDVFVDALLGRVACLQQAGPCEDRSLERDGTFTQLNGAFTVLCADERGICIITDLLGCPSVYAGRDKDNQLCALGTHQDVVAYLTGEPLSMDLASAAEYLNSATTSFPHTMHERVKRLDPASVYWFGFDGNTLVKTEIVSYWRPPPELREYDEKALVSELRPLFVEAVRKRCRGSRIAVSLSGGLDSRLIMAAVPKSLDCIGLTFCDELNRETKTAARVAACYGRQWFPLYRDREHIARMTEQAVRLGGCESCLLEAHVIGLTEEIYRHQVDSVLSGLKMDVYLRCCSARDMIRVPRWAGLLPPKYVHRSVDLTRAADDFWGAHLQEAVLTRVRRRREDFFVRYADADRTSLAEWFDIYPVYAGPDGWLVERRLLKMVLPAIDRKLIEFCFKCPVALKLDSRVFKKAAEGLYGGGRRIPNANDGVRPGSGHISRLAQRAVRKLHDRMVRTLEKLGRTTRIEHSWHDYQKYWRESVELDRLRGKYAANLDRLDGTLFQGKGRVLLEDKQIRWEHGFRLLQLAVWLGIMEEDRRDVVISVAGAGKKWIVPTSRK